MKREVLIVLAIALSTLAFYHLEPTSDSPALQREPIDYLNFNTDCTKALEVECAIDVERTVIACAKAFQTGGSDIIADIKCAKDLLSDKKHCWPCICAEAKKKGWHVIGC